MTCPKVVLRLITPMIRASPHTPESVPSSAFYPQYLSDGIILTTRPCVPESDRSARCESEQMSETLREQAAAHTSFFTLTHPL